MVRQALNHLNFLEVSMIPAIIGALVGIPVGWFAATYSDNIKSLKDKICTAVKEEFAKKP